MARVLLFGRLADQAGWRDRRIEAGDLSALRAALSAEDPGLGEAQVNEHCRANLTAYKCPKHISFIDALPKSAVGKVLRRELRG